VRGVGEAPRASSVAQVRRTLEAGDTTIKLGPIRRTSTGIVFRRVLTAVTLGLLCGCTVPRWIVPDGAQGSGQSIPGERGAFPQLADVPARPAPLDPERRNAVAEQLAADRNNARHTPLPGAPVDLIGVPADFPATPPPPPRALGSAGPRIPDPRPDAGPAAALPAFATPPAAPRLDAPRLDAPRLDAPRLDAPRLDGVRLEAPPSAQPGGPTRDLPGNQARQPDAPATPGDAPALPPPVAATEGGVPIRFAPGSAILPADSLSPLAALVDAGGQANPAPRLRIIGFGEAADAAPEIQAEAVQLGLARAQAVALALRGQGVQAARLILEAAARGPFPGAEVLLVD